MVLPRPPHSVDSNAIAIDSRLAADSGYITPAVAASEDKSAAFNGSYVGFCVVLVVASPEERHLPRPFSACTDVSRTST